MRQGVGGVKGLSKKKKERKTPAHIQSMVVARGGGMKGGRGGYKRDRW